MIYINNQIISTKLFIESYEGLFDFPKSKSNPVDWMDSNYVVYSQSCRELQFNERKITINCVLIGATFAACQTEFNITIKNKLQVNGLQMMTIPSISKRAYLVMINEPVFASTNYDNNNCIFRFSLSFIEPQPYNVQFHYEVGASVLPVNISIAKSDYGQSNASEKQRYINVWFQGSSTEVNIEQTSFSFTGNLAANTRHHLIITGDIDTMDYIFADPSPEYKAIANYYFRNGVILP